MKIKQNILLAPYTTLKIGGPARFFCVVKTLEDVHQALKFARDEKLQIYILGGGSNLVVGEGGFDGLVIKVENKGLEIIGDSFLKVAAGEVWDEVVKYSVDNNFWGMENLSHIPGSTGAVAVQNVGAYGQEAKDIIENIIAIQITSGKTVQFEPSYCKFAYRTSIFNTTEQGKYIIWEITFKLSKTSQPNLAYRDLAQKFAGQNPSLQEIRQAVIEIRDRKFPFPTEAKNGNVGSFFKNPILAEEQFQNCKELIVKNFGKEAGEKLDQKIFHEEANIKIPSAFLLDICGLKDVSVGGAAINHNQPLVILNASGFATSNDIIELAKLVQTTIKDKTGITLKAEPEFVGTDSRDLK